MPHTMTPSWIAFRCSVKKGLGTMSPFDALTLLLTSAVVVFIQDMFIMLSDSGIRCQMQNLTNERFSLVKK